jgi:hypothetical protein
MMTVWFRPVLVLGLFLLSSPVWAAPPVPVTTCGQTLRGPTRYVLPANLDCPWPGPGLTLDSASLDLRGFTLSCAFPNIGCLTLEGQGAEVVGGTIDGGSHESLVLEGAGSHRVMQVVLTPLDAAVLILSDHNRLRDVTATSGVHPAFLVQGNDNRLSQLVAVCPFIAGHGCIDVKGHGNRLEALDVTVTETQNAPPVSLGAGAVQLTGNDNEVRLSTLRNTDGPAIIVDGHDNRLFANRLDGIPDAVDLSGGCTANHWKRNLFLTATGTLPCLLPLPGAHPDDDAAALN